MQNDLIAVQSVFRRPCHSRILRIVGGHSGSDVMIIHNTLMALKYVTQALRISGVKYVLCHTLVVS